MGEHDNMSTAELERKINQRLSEGKPVGRLIDSARKRGVNTRKYQYRRTTTDLQKHVAWDQYKGGGGYSEEAAELDRREDS